jgi:PAS domain-containing protein
MALMMVVVFPVIWPSEPFKDIEDARALAQAIGDTVREPLLVLDGDLRVLAVSRSYYLTFRVDRQDVLGRPLYALGDGQWHIPALRSLLPGARRHGRVRGRA